MSNSTGLKDAVITLSELAASFILPGSVNTLVSRLIPGVVEMILGPDQLAAIIKEGVYKTNMTTEDGIKFTITLTQQDDPTLFDTFREAHDKLSATASGTDTVRTIHRHGFSISHDPKNLPQSGGISILNGIIGIQW